MRQPRRTSGATRPTASSSRARSSLGPLDLFVDMAVGSGRSFYHTTVLPEDVPRKR
jgi:hypothetical protein